MIFPEEAQSRWKSLLEHLLLVKVNKQEFAGTTKGKIKKNATSFSLAELAFVQE
jgi:hypothetical protein